MKSIRHSGEHQPHSKAGTFVGFGVLAIAPLAAGVAMLTIRHFSLRDMQAAQTWVATPCIVETCEFVTHDSNDGQRTLEIVYRYKVNGRAYKGDRLDLIVGRMGDDDVFEETVHRSYPPGARATCYVDPANPSNSVFDREHGADAPRRMWLLAFPFVCVGSGFSLLLVGAIVGSLQKAKTGSGVAPTELTSAPGPPPRDVPGQTRAIVLSGPVGAQMAWPFFVGFTFIFIILDGPAAYARLFDLWPEEATVMGRVTDVRKLDEREAYVSIYQYTIEFEVDGQDYTSDSYTRGKKYDEGDEVEIIYDAAKPAEGTIAGTRPSNFTWLHSAIPLGVLLLLAVGLGGMYVHNIRVLWLLKRGNVTQALWMEPQPGSFEAQDDAGQVPSMLSHFQFEIGGRYYRSKKYSPGYQFTRRTKSPVPSQSDQVIVLYNPNKPTHNIILNGGLADMINGCHSTWDHVVHCGTAPLALVVLVVLLRGAELI